MLSLGPPVGDWELPLAWLQATSSTERHTWPEREHSVSDGGADKELWGSEWEEQHDPQKCSLFPWYTPQHTHMHTHMHTIHTYTSSAFEKLKFNFPASSKSSFLQRESQICREATASSAPALLHVLVTLTQLINKQGCGFFQLAIKIRAQAQVL